MGALFGDLRYSVRSLAKDRAFTLVAVLTLTVCLGANVAVFVVVLREGSRREGENGCDQKRECVSM